MSDVPEAEIKKVVIDYLLDRRSALCRELASVERQLERLGSPVRNPIESKRGMPAAVSVPQEK